jgi:hypothetical protein
MMCKYAKITGGKNDGAGCKKKRTVFKNDACNDKELAK